MASHRKRKKKKKMKKKKAIPCHESTTLWKIVGSQIVFHINLKSRYCQVEIHSDDKPKTAFTTGKAFWQFNVTPFRFCNAPVTFELLMEAVLQGMNRECCIIFG